MSDATATQENVSKSEPAPEAATPTGEAPPSTEVREPQAEQEAPPAEVPYDLTVPEGLTLDDDGLKSFIEWAKESELTPAAAQKLLERDAQTYQKQVEAFEKEVQGWEQKTKDEFKERFNEAIEHSKAVVERFGDDELKEQLEQTGLGNHPMMVRFLDKIGAAMAEDRFVSGSAKGGRERTAAQRLWPNMA